MKHWTRRSIFFASLITIGLMGCDIEDPTGGGEGGEGGQIGAGGEGGGGVEPDRGVGEGGAGGVGGEGGAGGAGAAGGVGGEGGAGAAGGEGGGMGGEGGAPDQCGDARSCPDGQVCEDGNCVDDGGCDCPDVYQPVCGANGQTYGNGCQARCAGVPVASEGECPVACGDASDCPIIEDCQATCTDGVCGQDCGGCRDDAACAEGEVCRDERCVPDEGCLCPRIYAPVCGEDGMTYGNDCLAECAGVEFRPGECGAECDPVNCDLACEFGFETGEDGCEICACAPAPGCRANADCPQPGAPNCAGVCVRGQCQIECEEPELCRDDADCPEGTRCADGQCVRIDECLCPDVFQPVCGADGNTYNNACEARCAGVEVIGEGECRGQRCETPDDCPPGFRCDAGGCLPIRCRADADCPDGLACTDEGLCQPAGPVCPDPNDPNVSYISDSPRECAGIAFRCEPGSVAFNDECGCGCIRQDVPFECRADADCARGERCVDGVCVGDEPCVCPEIYDPVCGVDGRTYGNACQARCARVEVAYDGECRDICPDPEDPRVNYISQDPRECAVIDFACAPGQEAFSNECGCGCIGEPQPPRCEANDDCARGQVCVDGVCIDDEPCICPDVWDPVCGVDGRTYGNRCEARCAGAEVEYEGECRDMCPDPDDPRVHYVSQDPDRCAVIRFICEPGQEAFSNACGCGCIGDPEPPQCADNADCDRGEVCRAGQCEPDEGCFCPQVFDPVCGVDGRTYGNACMARCAGVAVAYEGECREPICREDAECADGERCLDGVCVAPEPCICPENYDPVCGVDGRTYGNACQAECARVAIAYRGECRQIECRQDADCARGEACQDGVCVAAQMCPDPENPQVHYVSQDPDRCAVIRFQCEDNQEAFSNECGCGCIDRIQACDCPQIFDPVCGANGVTYGNACEARCAGVEFEPGPCREPVECERGQIPVNGECEQSCRGNQDCARGQTCNAAEVCLPDPECPVCDVCSGWCVDGAVER